MHRASSPVLRTLSLIAAFGLQCSLGQSQTLSERESALHAFALSYGPPVNEKKPHFTIGPDHILVPIFSDDGLLIEISIEPTSRQDPSRVAQLSRAEFDSLLATITSIKRLGGFEEDFGAKFVTGGRAHGTQRYQNAYLETEELMAHSVPLPINSARIYYLHPVTGVPRIGRDGNLQDASSFGLVCVGGELYIAPKSEFIKLWSKPKEQQTVELAGPTEDACSQDETLLKKGLAALENHKFDIAQITLQTLVNTYPDSEYASKAKQLLADPRIAKCGEDAVICDSDPPETPPAR